MSLSLSTVSRISDQKLFILSLQKVVGPWSAIRYRLMEALFLEKWSERRILILVFAKNAHT